MRFQLALVLFTTVVACSSNNNNLPDSGGTDGNNGPDAGGTPVAMLVTVDGVPTAGVEVYFLNADSSLVATKMTDSTGVASAHMASGGSVTVIEPAAQSLAASAPDGTILDTFLAVKQGDQLQDAIFINGAAGSGGSATFNVTVPTDLKIAVASYEFDTACGTADISAGSGSSAPAGVVRVPGVTVNNAPVSVELDGCPATTDITIVTRDANNVVVDSIFSAAHGIANGSNITIAGPYVAGTNDEFSVSGLGSNATDGFFVRDLSTAAGFMIENEPDVVDVTLGSDGNGSGSGVLVSPTVTAVEELISGEFDSTTPFEDQFSLAWRPAAAGFNYDGSTQLLPHFTADPTYDLASNSITWTSSGGGATPDGVIASFDVDRPAAGSGADATWQWFIVAPGTAAGSVAYPTLPTDVFDFTPAAADTVTYDGAQTLTFPGGYDAFRVNPFGQFDPNALVAASPTGSEQSCVNPAQGEEQDGLRRAHHTRSHKLFRNGHAVKQHRAHR